MKRRLSKRMAYASALTLGFIGLTATGLISAQMYFPSVPQASGGFNGLSPEDEGRETYRTCMEAAVRQRESELVHVYQEYYRVHLALVQERSQAVIGVWSIADATERSRAESDLERGYREARRQNDNALHDAEREINDLFQEHSRECRRQQQDRERQIQDAQREQDRLRREQERAARPQSLRAVYGTQARPTFDNDRRYPTYPTTTDIPEIKVREYRPAYPSASDVTLNSAVTARSYTTVTSGVDRPALRNDPYYYDPYMGNWRVPANERFDASLSRNTQPFGPMPQGVCGTPWTTPGLGLAGDNLPLAACIW